MEKLVIHEDIPVFYQGVERFPIGIKEAFDSLYEKFANRDYYGISYMDEQCRIIYKAAVQELIPGEGLQNGYEPFILLKGNYIAETLHNWMSRTDQIKAIFGGLMENPLHDKAYPCVEWYKTDEEMICLVRSTEQKNPA